MGIINRKSSLPNKLFEFFEYFLNKEKIDKSFKLY